MLKEQMIKDYIFDNGYNTFPECEISGVVINGDEVMFDEEYQYESTRHNITLLNLMCWIYSKTK